RRRHTRSDRDWSSDVCSSDLERGAHHLRLTAEAVGVLDAAALDVAGQDVAALEQAVDRGGDADLSGLAAQLGDARVERLGRALRSEERRVGKEGRYRGSRGEG